MKTKKSKRILSVILALAMIFSCLVTPAMAAPVSSDSGQAPQSLTQSAAEQTSGGTYAIGDDGKAIAPDAQVRILVRLEEEPVYLRTGDLQTAAQNAPSLLEIQARAEARIEKALDKQIEVENNFTLLFNGFSFTGEYWMLEAINEMGGVSATIPAMFELVEPADSETLTPSMGTSTGLTNAAEAWKMGYTGEGTVVAVVDTGIRATHDAFSVMPENGKIDMAYLKDVYAQYGDKMHAGTAADLDAIYENEKLPFNWDYFDNDAVPNHTASDHGTHVAGIAAGNNGSDFKGVAPDAQIVTMQVFTDGGGAYWDTILCALEDCVYLGVDAINMSLGSPAGFTSYESAIDGFQETCEALENAGISIVVAAGNDGSTLAWTNYGNWFQSIYRGLSSNPDVGVVGSPSTLPASFSVASVVNDEAPGSIKAYGKNYIYGSVAGQPSLSSLIGEHEMVYVGLGYYDSYTDLDVAGKIVLVQRGDITFTEKCIYAANAGAIGVIIFNNASGSFSPSVESSIPLGLLTLAEGNSLIADFPDGVTGTVTISNEKIYSQVEMAETSSWGSTADLRITPDIAAPGDNVTSAIGFGDDTSYETWSGTSMATPQVSAGLSIIKQHIRELLPNAEPSEINDLAYAFAMSTAHQVSGFVRQQGAGLMDIASALSTEVYLSVEDNDRPKLELGENEEGTFTFSFTLNNAGTSAHTYTISPSVLTERVTEEEYSGTYFIENDPAMVKLISGTVYDVTGLCDITAPETVTVAAGQTATVEMTISCTDELMAYFQENCPSGMFLEGYISLQETGTETPVDLSIPFLGFVGDWDYASMLDRGYYWQEAIGENNYQQLSTSNANFVGYMTDQGLGLNRYADMTGKTYLADRNAISPNGDGILDALTYIEFTLLRNPKTLKLYLQDAEGNLLKTIYDEDYVFTKDYYETGFNGGDTFGNILFEYAAEDLGENETVYLVLETWLDHEGYDPADNESGRWIIPVTKDVTAPAVKVVDGGIEIIDANYTAYYAVYADEAKTELLYETGVFAEERGVAETYATDRDTLYVVTADYAGNEQFCLVSNGVVVELDADAFDHGRTIIGMRSKDYSRGIYDFDWVSFQTELSGTAADLNIMDDDYLPSGFDPDWNDVDLLSSAVTNDGTLYANNFHNLYTLDPETLERTFVCELAYPDENINTSVKNISVDPETDQLYAWAQLFNTKTYASGEYLFRVDIETGTLTKVFQFCKAGQYNSIWAMTFLDNSEIAVYDDGPNNIVILDLEGNVVRTYAMDLTEPVHSADFVGIQGFNGDMLYDREANAVYITSDWSWFFIDRYYQGGMIKYDFDTGTPTMSLIGNYGGMVVHSLFFEDSVGPDSRKELTDFALDQTALDLIIGSTATVNVTTDPANANQFTMEWISSDESVASVSGMRRKATITAVNPGKATITATAYDMDGNVIGSKTVDVTVTYDLALQEALNVEGGSLGFIAGSPYSFVPTVDPVTGRYYAASSNTYVDNSSASVTMTQLLHKGDTLSYDFFVSSEDGWDIYWLYVNGEMKMKVTGDWEWVTYNFYVPETGTYTFEWVYTKDGSGYAGLDTAGLDNVTLHYGVEGVIALIDAIGEVTLESGSAIETARNAYDALDSSDQAQVYNYQTLLDAEQAYVSQVSVGYIEAAEQAAQAAEQAAEAAKATYEAAQQFAEEAQAHYAENTEAAKKAAQEAENAKAAAEAAQASADAAQQAVQDAVAAAEAYDLAAVINAANKAQQAAQSAAEAAEVAAAARDAAKAQERAQAAQTAAEAAQAAADEALIQAEEAWKNAEENNNESAEKAAQEAKDAAEAAQAAAGDAAEAAEAAAAAADGGNHAAAEYAALAAQYAREIAEMNLLIARQRAELTDELALADAKYKALIVLAELANADTSDYSEHQAEAYAAAIEAAWEAIEAASSPAEIDAALEALYAAIAAIEASCPASGFTDVDLNRWYHESVDFMVMNGYMKGVSATRFAPDAALTRAELVTVLYRIAGKPSVEDLTTPFTDVAEGKWYTDAIVWAANVGIVTGVTETTFAPNDVATREQLVTILYRFNGAEDVDSAVLDAYTDKDAVSKYASDAMAWAVGSGIVTGVTTTTLAPKGTATRAQIAVILARCLEA